MSLNNTKNNFSGKVLDVTILSHTTSKSISKLLRNKKTDIETETYTLFLFEHPCSTQATIAYNFS